MTRISISLLFILIPFFLSAQTLEPVISKDYLLLIQTAEKKRDSTYSLRKYALTLDGTFNMGSPIKRIRVVDGKLKITRNHIYRLAFGGSMHATMELKTINHLPALQHQFVQGRTVNGVLTYRGPETNEVFSYGPSLPAGTPAFHPAIFRTAAMFSQAFNLQTDLFRDGRLFWNLDVKLGRSNEQTFIRENENSGKNLALTLRAYLKGLDISGSYNYLNTRFTNSNRNGFLNRAYQNSLLTPVSFGDPYNSYSELADNPNFLLQNSGNNFFQTQRNGSLIIGKRKYRNEVKLTQSYEKVEHQSFESYKPGTAYFPNGMAFQRNKNDASYFLNAYGSYHTDHNSSSFDSDISGNYSLQDVRSNINAYNYQRTAQQFLATFATKYNNNGVDLDMAAGNRIYVSNTAKENKYFSPSLRAQVRLRIKDFNIRVNAGYNQSYHELAISQSLSYANLLQYSTAQAMQYFPVKEVTGYDQLLPVSNREWTGGVTLMYKSKVSLSGEVFLKNIRNDLFPIYENDALLLKNIADHRKQGAELQLQLYDTYIFSRLFTTSHRASFFVYNDKVTQVTDGYNFTPVAGFSNVHKAIVKNAVLGAIVGNTYQRDGNGQIVTGPEGFPLVNDQLSVIGNPIPDFVLKMNHDLRWKKLTFGIDWEWKKGGDIWNGTQAALDYYGRSENARDTKGYVFPGVTADGHVNTKPVDFYNPALPLEQNRWVRYGESGVAESYIQRADHLRINSLQLSWLLPFKHTKFPQQLILSTYVNNLMLWTAYKGADPNQALYDQPNTAGLDFFNLPSTKTYGFNVSLQF